MVVQSTLDAAVQFGGLESSLRLCIANLFQKTKKQIVAKKWFVPQSFMTQSNWKIGNQAPI